MSKYAGQPMSRKEIRSIASGLRIVFGLGKGYVDIVNLIENIIPYYDSSFEWEICSAREMQFKAYAYYYSGINKLVIDERTYQGACNGIGRDRFTLAHEVGHYILHGDQAVLQRVSSDTPIPIFQDPEWQANTFASEFLAPYNEIIGMKEEQICQLYGLSMEASKIAVKNAKKPN